MTDSNVIEVSDTLMHGMFSEEDFFAHMSEMTDEESLEHFGVKGMKWGKSSAAGPKLTADGREVKSRKELRSLNKASEKASNASRDGDIDSARARINTGENRKNYLDAKQQYKSDKKVIGKVEANKAFQAVKDKNIADAVKAGEYKSGKETTTAIVSGVAGALLLAYLAN